MKILKAIHTCHIGKYKTLNIKTDSKQASWNPEKDVDWLDYLHARDFMESKHPLITKLLKWIDIL